MSRFILPFQSVFDKNGHPLDGAKLYFYETGTSTLKDTYSDAARTTANANPVIANSQGEFGEIFLNGEYRVELKDKNDVTQPEYPEDNVSPTDAGLRDDLIASTGSQLVTYKQGGTGSVARTLDERLQDEVSVFDYMTTSQVANATNGDGDLSAPIQLAIDANPHVILPKGFTFVIGTTLTLPSNFTLEINGTLLLAANTANDFAMIKNSDRVSTQNNIHITGTGIISGNKSNQITGSEIQHVCIDLLKVRGCTISVAEVGSNKWDNAYQDVAPSGITACIAIRDCAHCSVSGVLLYQWEREGISIEPSGGDCYNNSVHDIIAEGSGAASYSGVQVGGAGALRNTIDNIIVRDSGASGVGMDSMYSAMSNVTVYNNLFQHGVNFGHSGAPASYSVASNITVYNAGSSASSGTHSGVNVGSSTVHLSLSNITVNIAYSHGINISDGASDILIVNAKIISAGVDGFRIFNSERNRLINCYSISHGGVEIGITGTTTDYAYLLSDTLKIDTIYAATKVQTAELDAPSSGIIALDNVCRVVNTSASSNPRLDPVTDNTFQLGDSTKKWKNTYTQILSLTDGITPPSPGSNAQIYIDTADGNLKIKFSDGFVATIAVDS